MKALTDIFLTRTSFWFAVAVGILLPLAASAQNAGSSLVVRGDVTTGINRFCGSPLYSLPVPDGLPPTAGAENLAEFNPNGVAGKLLTTFNCDDDIILANFVEPGFLAAIGVGPVNPRFLNHPLRTNFVYTGLDGSRGMIPRIGELTSNNPLPPTRSKPNFMITLGQWTQAFGLMRIDCPDEGFATVDAVFGNLIPNGVYSMWGVWNTTPPGAPGAQIVPIPLGGVPNAVVPDREGNASFFRELAQCPLNPTEDGSIMMFITLAYHSDADLNGTFPELGQADMVVHDANGTFTTRLGPGAVTHDAMEFLVNGERLPLP